MVAPVALPPAILGAFHDHERSAVRSDPDPSCASHEPTDRLYYDTAAFSPVLLARLVEDVGADHVLLGTDHPFELADRTPVQTVRSAGLVESATRAILWDNAATMLGVA
jgi:predicted TIM-barrel fold metal-dependent hydrolase